MRGASLLVLLGAAWLGGGCVLHARSTYPVDYAPAPGVEYRYYGHHPVPDGDGGGWCFLGDVHIHVYEPIHDVYSYSGAYYTYRGPTTYWYFDLHPLPTGGSCHLHGRHVHDFSPGYHAADYGWDRGRRGYVYRGPESHRADSYSRYAPPAPPPAYSPPRSSPPRSWPTGSPPPGVGARPPPSSHPGAPPPGSGGSPSDPGGRPRGKGWGVPPGHGGTPPGQGGMPPGHGSGNVPPGHQGTPPGRGREGRGSGSSNISEARHGPPPARFAPGSSSPARVSGGPPPAFSAPRGGSRPSGGGPPPPGRGRR